MSMIVWRYDGRATALLDLGGYLFSVLSVSVIEDDVAAVAFGGLHFQLWSIFWHNYGSIYVQD